MKRWRLPLFCAAAVALLALGRSWGQAQAEPIQEPDPSTKRIVLEMMPREEGQQLRLQADALYNHPDHMVMTGNVVIWAGTVRIHVPQASVRIVPKGADGFRDIFVE
jgi:hypothetical protein